MVMFRVHGAMVWPRWVVSMLKPDLAISLKRELADPMRPRLRRHRRVGRSARSGNPKVASSLTRSINVLWKEADSCEVGEEPTPATASVAQLSGRSSCRSLARSARRRNSAGPCRYSLVGGWGGRQRRSLGTSIRHRSPDRRGCVMGAP
jgi:hypothetical protein